MSLNKNSSLVLGVLCAIFIGNAQTNDSIVLPEKDLFSRPIEKKLDKQIKIKVDSSERIFADSTRINYWGQIFHYLMKEFHQNNKWFANTKIIIEADKDVGFDVISNIFDEVARFPFKFVFVKVGEINLDFYNIIPLHGSTKTYWTKEIINTGEVSIVPIEINQPFGPNSYNRISDFEVLNKLKLDFYELNLNAVYKSLEKYRVKNLVIMPEGQVHFNNQYFKLNELDSCFNDSQGDLVILTTFDSELKFKDYMSYVKEMNLIKQNRPKKERWSDKVKLIEISNRLESKLKKTGFNFN